MPVLAGGVVTITPRPHPHCVSGWTFLSHHAQVFVCINSDPDARLRDIADKVGITERAVQGIVNDLVDEGYLSRVRVGRRNHYEVHAGVPMRHALQRDIEAGTLLRLLTNARDRREAAE
jgi:predicted transcriptional regulator